MAYKKTGRPVGRPKTKEYVTMLARVPAELADLVKRYAAEHGSLPVAELIREGLEWRIGDGDPRGTGMYLSQPVGVREKTYYANTETASSLDSSTLLADMQTSLARQEAQIQALTQMLEQQTALLRSYVYSSNTSMPANEVVISYQEAQHTQLAPLVEEQVPDSAIPATVPPYDLAKHHLGTLCHNKHEWGSAGQSLRNADNQCLECKAQAKRDKRQATRSATGCGVIRMRGHGVQTRPLAHAVNFRSTRIRSTLPGLSFSAQLYAQQHCPLSGASQLGSPITAEHTLVLLMAFTSIDPSSFFLLKAK